MCNSTPLKKLFTLAVALFISFNLTSQTYSDPDDLADAVNAAAATGGTFIVPNGTYNDFEATFQVVATEANPIIIKAETIGGVTLTGSSHFVFKKSAYITLEGFVIDGVGEDTLVKLEGCNNIRITRNVFELDTTESIKWVFVGGYWDDYTFQFLSHDNRIDHNIFQNKTTPGHYITIDGTHNEDESIYQQSQNDRIDHNYFKNNQPRAANEKESIRIGWSEMSLSSGYTVVEFNLFEDCDGDPEIVSVKSCDNIIRHNTFLKSYGTLSLRHGNRNRVEGNYFFGGGKANGTFETSTIYTGGIRIYGTDHVIVNNYFEGLQGTGWDAPITLTQGDAIDGQSTSLSKHFRAERVTIAYNTLVDNVHGIEIGFDNNNNYNTGLKDITFANNLVTGSTNSLVSYIEGQDQGDEITWINNIMYPTGAATLTSDGSTFASGEVLESNPNLTYDGTVWKSTDTSPTIASGVPTLLIDEDIEGQTRPDISNAGADHYSLETIRYAPLTPTDVGPDAYGDEEPSENLYLTTVSEFSANGETQTVTVTSNLAWTVTDDSDWITPTPLSGTDDGSIDVTVAANPTYEQRSGVVTVTGGDITRTLNIIQAAADATSGLNLINGGMPSDPVTVTASTEQVDGVTYFNYATNTLDKDFDTRWSGEGIGAELIYDLGDLYDLDLVSIATLSGKTYLYEILTSTDGINYTSVSNVQSNTLGTFEHFPVTNQARFVKIIGGGQTGGSVWNSITETEIYGTTTLSVFENELSKVIIYPVPAKDVLKLKNLKNAVKKITIYSREGRNVIEKSLNSNQSETYIDISSLSNGAYIINLSDGSNSSQSKMILISK